MASLQCADDADAIRARLKIVSRAHKEGRKCVKMQLGCTFMGPRRRQSPVDHILILSTLKKVQKIT